MLAEETFGINPFRDNRWYNFAYISPSAGDSIAGYMVFKLVVEVLSGNDGNVAVSRNLYHNIPPDGLRIIS